MWLMTNRGFYSIVEKPWDKPDSTLTVRARRRSDIEAFLALIEDNALDSIPSARADHMAEGTDFIEFDDRADYAWRVRVPRTQVGLVVARVIGGIDYDNFKSDVAKKGLHDHASCYSSVWGAMSRLQDGGAYSSGNRPKGGGGQTHLPFSNSFGGATEAGVAEAVEPWTAAEEWDDWTCPHCSEQVDPEAFRATGACDNCETELVSCLGCGEWLGGQHDCTDYF